jgi:Leucine-rich repeat (LRR) protein
LKSLVEINFSNNLINFLPNEIGYLKELEIMNLSFNKLEQIPSTIGNVTKLKKLDLSENCLKYLPDELNSLSLLEELLLFKNRLSHNDCFTWEGLSNLKYLDLHNNFLELMTNLPKSEKLDTLILGYNRLQNIEKLENCPNLTVLDLNNNKIENFPEEILNLQNLKTLNLMNNSINDLPPQVSLLQNLVRINIEGNPLKKINSKIRSANAEHLKAYLKTRLPEDIGGSNKINFEIKSNLQQSQNILNYHHNNRLQMNNLNLTVLPIDEIKQSVNLKLLVTLDFSNNVIKNLDEIKNLKSLKNNNISKKSSNLFEYENPNPLKYLNDQFDNFLPELREIKFSNNKIEIFPEFFVNFYNVKIIELKNNMISNFFDEICCRLEDSAVILPSLEYLDLSINKFLILPKILKFFKNLNVIIISNNSIKEISNLCQVEYCNLNTLDLGDNKIENLNYKLYRNFPNLKTFNIENNEIKTIPTDLCLLPHLSKLNLQGNPIKMLRSNIINGGTKTIIEHFRKMHKFDGEDFSFDKKNNYQFENKNTKNLEIASCQEKKIDAQEDIKTGMQNHVSDIDQVNAEILDVESELKNNTNMPMYKKTDLRKKLNNLIRLRANLMKY